MQNSSHIITLSNAPDKKLSFQGWEKCVEAFSQGRGSLSHHCARLLNSLDPSQQESFISWSSSDEDSDGVSMPSRSRPVRTLSSQIDFSDCVSTRKKGRRHSYARFSRSIEKQSHLRELESLESSAAFSEQDRCLTDARVNIQTVMPVNCNSINMEQKDPVLSCYSHEGNSIQSETSLLNKRIVLFEDTQIGETLSGAVGTTNENDTPDNSRDVHPLKCVDLSPIFKSSVTKRKTRNQVKSCYISYSRRCTPDDPDEKTTEQRNATNVLSTDTVSGIVNHGAGSTAASCESPLKIGSPIFNRSTVKKRKNTPKSSTFGKLSAPPIVSSPGKSPVFKRNMPHRRRKKEILQGPSVKPNVTIEGSSITNISKPCDQEYSKSSVMLPKWSLALSHENSFEDGISTHPNEEPVAAKRSLDFSSPQHLDTGSKCMIVKHSDKGFSSVECAHPTQEFQYSAYDSDVVESSLVWSTKLDNDRFQNDDTPSATKFSGIHSPDKQAAINKSKNQALALTSSFIIEEDNTEQVELCNKDIPKAASEQKVKKRSLSLKKRALNKDSTHAPAQNSTFNQISHSISQSTDNLKKTTSLLLGKKNDMSNDSCNNSNWKANIVDPGGSFHPSKHKGILKNNNSSDSPVHSHHDFTCRIEEINSEPLLKSPEIKRKPSKKGFTARGPMSFAAKPEQLSLWKGFLDQKQHNLKCVEDSREDSFEIDSCSSLSPEETSNIDQVCGIVSPVSISQSSSLEAACAPQQSDQPSPADNFETPAKKGKRKFQPGGLAYRLQRLLNRKRSSATIWQFQRSKQSLKKREDLSSSVAHCSPGQSDATLITVSNTWVEYSHVLIQGSLAGGTKESGVLNRSIIIVLDPCVADKFGQAMTASMIRLFPPWQSLTLKKFSVILCATCIEIVPSSPTLKQLKKHLVFSKEFHCSCVNGMLQESCTDHCGLLLGNVNGTPIKFLDLLFSENQKDVACPLTIANKRPSGMPFNKSTFVQESISQLISSHYSSGTASKHLSVTVLSIFKYWPQSGVKDQETSPTWSLLAKDVAGDLCEIILGSKCSCESSMWSVVESDSMVGRTYQFSGLIPSRRICPFRASTLWSVAQGILSGLCEQTVLYVLSPSGSTWNCKLFHDGVPTPLQFSQLHDVISKRESPEPHRYNVHCRLLHSSSEVLYVTDSSLIPYHSVINLQSSIYVPSNLSSAHVVTLCDIEVVSGEIRADKYSRINIIDLNETHKCPSQNIEELQSLKLLKLHLPLLHVNTPVRTLASVVGTITGVDEESAFIWPACGHCGNELLCMEAENQTYKCGKCIDLREKVVLRMSLQVILSCENLPQKSIIRIKLLQSTIEKLLPSSLSSEGGYDMNTVLGHRLGPLSCEVLSKEEGNFVLQELAPLH